MGKLLPNIIKVGKWLFVLFLLVACENEKSSKLVESNPMTKHQLESLLKEENYDEIRYFIKQNAKNVEKEPIVDYAIEALNQTGEMENHSFLKELFIKWIEARDYETLNLYITNLETEGNGESVTTFLHS
ncbi:hypothetical protein ACFWGC_27600 [Cytobacillus pseudoceanisediminis]|uniref:HEAT repeat domain-containing protein n=1 Tax=Cytobacillus oceanisediminis TaxID=665099 RepID=A0ABX3CXZ7_9BACI|nr:hypothetical protein [Cytobacillus oceanisediminis]OHX49941.1 hypothetical protein BBV17_10620 [Cytobacillus oceanisediminis]